MSRTACIWIPRFELQSRCVAEPSLRAQPVLLADIGSLRALVIAASPEASAAGVHPRMPLSMARALCPEAMIIPPDPKFVREQCEHILAALYRFAPQVGRDDEGAFFLGLEGLSRVHPDERVLAEALQRTIAAFELTASVAIADSPVSAWVVAHALSLSTSSSMAARGGRLAIEVVPSGRDRQSLARLPLEAIPMPDQLARLCRVLGLETVGELQRLPAGALARRFGRGGLDVEQRARARSRDLFRVEVPEVIEQSELSLDQPTADLEPLLFLHKSVLDRLLKQVAATHRAVAALEVTLVLADSARSKVCHTFRPVRPTLQGRVLLDLLNLWLAGAPVSDPVDAIVMRAVEVGVATARQLRLFERQEDVADDALQLAVSRLIASFGREAVVRPTLDDRYRPEDRLRWQPVAADQLQRDGSKDKALERGNSCAVATKSPPVLSLIDPPVAIEWRGDRLRAGGAGRWLRIVACDGPRVVEGEWWAQGFHRAYLLLTTEEAETLWIYRDAQGYHLHAYLD